MGVGGAGMSSLAVLLSEWGCEVSGCDVANAATLAQLRGLGVHVEECHDVTHVAHAQVVLWSPAVPQDHPELESARRAGATLMPRRDVLAELSTQMRLIGVTGTHGKTTATSMLVHICAAARRDDARLLGAPVRGVGFGGHWGPDDLICEVDESYGAFSKLTPYALGLLNIEADHLDHYGSLANLESAFVEVMTRTLGPVVVWSDDEGAARVASQVPRNVVTVGTSSQVRWRLVDEKLERQRARARLVGPQELEIDLGVTGRHNLTNAAVVAVLAMELGIAGEFVTDGLRHFVGAPRRFEHVATWRGIDVIDDYAHLPAEIAATVSAAQSAGYHRIVALFQPHRVSRTRSIGADFAPAFDNVDELVMTDIYRAGEENPEGITGEFLADFVKARAQTSVTYAASLRDASEVLEGTSRDKDLLLILGAGDVTTVLEHLHDVTQRAWTPRSSSAGPDDYFLGHDSRVEYGAALGGRTTYRAGGSVAALVSVASDDDLEDLSERLLNASQPLIVLGNGSNLLVAEGQHDVVVVHLVGNYAELTVSADEEDEDVVKVLAGGALDLPVAARRLASHGVVDFEWAVGVPGTFGGAVAMNAGGHGAEMKSSVSRVEVWSDGQRQWRDAREFEFAYRHSALGPGEIVTRVELTLRRGDAALARERIGEIVRWRREHQPGGANAGSVFRNPEGHSAGRLIEAAGLKGVRMGSAVVSSKHANFILVDERGSTDDVVALMRRVRSAVHDTSGVWLESEHRLIGFEENW